MDYQPTLSLFFCCQAEDGIRDLTVTGVQTCALPICGAGAVTGRRTAYDDLVGVPHDAVVQGDNRLGHRADVVSWIERSEVDTRAAVGDRGQHDLAVGDAFGRRNAGAFVDQRPADGRDGSEVVHRDARIITAMRYTGAERAAQGGLVAFALVFALVTFGILFRGADGGPGGNPTPTASAASRAPAVTITQATCCTQTARALLATWESSAHVNAAKLALTPDPGFECSATIDANGLKGTFSCRGLLKGATDFVATLRLTTAVGTFPFEHPFKTMGDRLA